MDETEQREILYRLDERTRAIQDSVEELDERMNVQQQQINSNTKRSRRNETKVNIASYLGGATVTALAATLMGAIPI